MARKKIKLALPFRFIRKSDASKDFHNQLYAVNKVNLASLVGENHTNQYVVVYDANPLVLGFIIFKDTGTHFYIDLVEKNELHSFPTLKPGTQLIDMVERISPNYTYKKVVLNAIVGTQDYYEEIGYQKTGKTTNDPVYGNLTEMEKLLD